MNKRFEQLNYILQVLLMLFMLSACSKTETPVSAEEPDTTVSTDTEEEKENTEQETEESEEITETPDPVSRNYIFGSLFSFQKDLRTIGPQHAASAATTLYNAPLYDPTLGSEADWWDNLVEEMAYSGLDYVAADLRGHSVYKTVDHGNPYRLKEMVEALDRRGVRGKFKIALFDDCPASWGALRNYDMGKGYTFSHANDEGGDVFPLEDLPETKAEAKAEAYGIYNYIWTNNIRLALHTLIEEANAEDVLLKIDGKPVVIFWAIDILLNVSKKEQYKGKLSRILDWMREDSREEFGMEPYFIVHHSFYRNYDETVKTNADAAHSWFSLGNKDTYYTLNTDVNGKKIGATLSGFCVGDQEGVNPNVNYMFIDPNHGAYLENSLKDLTQTKGAEMVIIEGFTDALENASLWRCIDKTYEETYYDYPNQRINILRRFSAHPYPKTLKVEMEGCDSYFDRTTGNSGGTYRSGNLDIRKCEDTNGGWCVTDVQTGEWMEWKELPFRKGNLKLKLRYASTSDAQVYFYVNEKGIGSLTSVTLPSTGGEWQTLTAGTVTIPSEGLRDLRLNIERASSLEINWFQMEYEE